MKITNVLVRSYAANCSAPQLREWLKAAQAELVKGSVITQVNGPGTGYTRQITMSPNEAVELFTLALETKEGRTVNPIESVSFYDPSTAC